MDKLFRRGQLLSAALYSLGHGGNDAQKTMGIIFVLLIAASRAGKARSPTPTEVPTEVVLACHVAMGLGTLFGGWRIVKTMGQKHHPPAPGGRLLRRDRRGGDAGPDDLRRHPGQHDAHDHRLDRRRRRA